MTKTREDVRAQLQSVFCDVFEDDSIVLSDAMTAEDIDEWDSLMHVSLIVAVEKEFNMRFNAAEVGRLENVGQMLSLIEERAS